MLVFPEREGKLDAKSFFKLPALTAMQDEFAVKVGRQFGLERGVRLTELLEKGEKPHRHQSVAVYKAKKLKETEQALSRLEQTTEDLAAIEAIQPQKNLFAVYKAKKLKETEQALSRLEQTTEDLAAIEAIQPQKNLFSSRVSVTQDEFETLSSQAKAYAATKEILQKRSKTLLERERSVESRETLTDKNECLTRQNKALAEENSRLRGALSTERSKNSILLTRIAELARLEQAEKELRELKAKLKDFEFYKNVHDFLKSSLQDFNKFLVPMNQWLQLEQAEKELRELKAKLKDFEFYKNVHDFLKSSLQDFNKFLVPMNQWLQKKRANERKQNNLER